MTTDRDPVTGPVTDLIARSSTLREAVFVAIAASVALTEAEHDRAGTIGNALLDRIADETSTAVQEALDRQHDVPGDWP